MVSRSPIKSTSIGAINADRGWQRDPGPLAYTSAEVARDLECGLDQRPHGLGYGKRARGLDVGDGERGRYAPRLRHGSGQVHDALDRMTLGGDIAGLARGMTATLKASPFAAIE